MREEDIQKIRDEMVEGEMKQAEMTLLESIMPSFQSKHFEARQKAQYHKHFSPAARRRKRAKMKMVKASRKRNR